MGQVVLFGQARPAAVEEAERGQPKERGSVKLRPGSAKLYMSFMYRGVHVQKSSGLPDTQENRAKLRGFLDRIFDKIDDGTFCFHEAFPGAPEQEKRLFARLEGRDYRPGAGSTLFGVYAQRWEQEIVSRYRSPTKKRDFLSILKGYLLPRFKDMTFEEINGVELVNFVQDILDGRGRTGKPPSPSRVRNILIPLRAIWEDACEEHGWELRDPFLHLKKKNRGGRVIPRRRKNPPEVFRFDEWIRVAEAMDVHFRPIAEIMVLTGMISSELAGLRRQDIVGNKILVRNSIVEGTEKPDLKTEYRVRDIPITKAIRERLDVLLARDKGEYLVRLPSGKTFDACRFWRTAWRRALRDAGIPHRRPYAMRHTFASWSLVSGMNPTRLVYLMGHGSKQMIYEVYAKYAEGVEEDAEKIRGYFGEDFR